MTRPAPFPRRPARRGARGIALIEALIGVLIFAIGVLGMVGLQVSMTRAQGSAKFRSDASYLASEIVGVMWVDKPNVANYATTPASACTYARCADWLAKVARELPSGLATVAVTPSTGDVAMTVTWTVPNEGSHSYAMATTVH